jgi:hypothetical protein
MDGNVQGKALLSVGVDAILAHQPQLVNKTKVSAREPNQFAMHPWRWAGRQFQQRDAGRPHAHCA